MLQKGRNYEIFRSILHRLQQNEGEVESKQAPDSSIMQTEVEEQIGFMVDDNYGDDKTQSDAALLLQRKNSQESTKTRESFMRCMLHLEKRKIISILDSGTFSFGKPSNVQVLIESLEAGEARSIEQMRILQLALKELPFFRDMKFLFEGDAYARILSRSVLLINLGKAHSSEVVRGQVENRAKNVFTLSENELIEAKRDAGLLLRKSAFSLSGKKELITTFLSREMLVDTVLADLTSVKCSEKPRLSIGDSFAQSSLVFVPSRKTSVFAISQTFQQQRFLHTETAAIMCVSRVGIEELARDFYAKIVEDRLMFLKSFRFIAMMQDRYILNIVPDLQEVVLRKGSLVYKESEGLESFYFLRDGEVELQGSVVDPGAAKLNPQTSRARDSLLPKRLLTLFAFQRGSYFGDLEYFAGDSHRKTRVEVLSSTATLFVIKFPTFLGHLRMSMTMEGLRADSQAKALLYEERMKNYKWVHNIVEEKKLKQIKEKAKIMEIIYQSKLAAAIAAASTNSPNVDIVAASPNGSAAAVVPEVVESGGVSVQLQQPHHKRAQSGKEKGNMQLQQQDVIQTGQVVPASSPNSFLTIPPPPPSPGGMNRSESLSKQQLFDEKKIKDDAKFEQIKETNRGYQQSKSSIKQAIGDRFMLSNDIKNEVTNRLIQQGKIHSIQRVSIKGVDEDQLKSPRKSVSVRPATTRSGGSLSGLRLQTTMTTRNSELPVMAMMSTSRDGFATDRPSNQSVKNGMQDRIGFQSTKSRKEEILANADEFGMKQMEQLISHGKNNFHQIFLNSLLTQKEKKNSLGQLRKGEKINHLMEVKRDIVFQGYLKKQVEYHQLRGEAPKKISPASGKFATNRGSSQKFTDMIAEALALQASAVPRRISNPFV